MNSETDPPIVVMMGVTGAGKSTIAELLAARLHWDFCEGDRLHPQRNIDTMAGGTPLTDADREPWLDAVTDWMTKQTESGLPGVITCSAIKRAYRDRLRAAASNLWLVNPAGPADLLRERLTRRTGHFVHPDLLASQLEDLETPGPDEHVLTVDIQHPAGQLVDEIVAWIGNGHDGLALARLDQAETPLQGENE